MTPKNYVALCCKMTTLYFYQDIIEQLIENSETFDKKTEFSQEKYLKKKRKRYIKVIDRVGI